MRLTRNSICLYTVEIYYYLQVQKGEVAGSYIIIRLKEIHENVDGKQIFIRFTTVIVAACVVCCAINIFSEEVKRDWIILQVYNRDRW